MSTSFFIVISLYQCICIFIYIYTHNTYTFYLCTHIHTNSYICIYEAEELKGNYDHDPINYLSDLKHLKAYSKENSLILYEFTF